MRKLFFFLSALSLLCCLSIPAGAEPLDLFKPSPNPRLQEDRRQFQSASALLREAKSRYLEVLTNQADVELTLGRMYLDTADLLNTMGNAPERVPFWLDKAEKSIETARFLLSPSRSVEARGLFIDAGSLPKSKEGIHALLFRLRAAHFNLVFPEVFRRGYTIYPSRYTALDPDFAGKEELFDYFMKEARRLGLEVHPWLWCFRVRSPGYGDPILSRLPALAARSNKTVEPRFLSPASPEARHLVCDLVEELATRYSPDGIMMDYIRYDEETPEDWISQTRFRLEQLKKTGKFPTEPCETAWQLWREGQIDGTVREINKRLASLRKKPVLAAAVFRNERYARLVKMQNWRHWSNNRWIRWASPMLYTNKREELDTWLGWETDGFQRKNLLYPILGIHRMDEPNRQVVEQIGELNRLNQGGVTLFALAHLPLGMIENLAIGPFRSEAYPPHHNPIQGARRALVEASNRYLGNIYRQADFDTLASALVLWQEMKKIEASIPFGELPFRRNEELLASIEGIDSLAHTMSKGGHLPRKVAEELSHRLEYAKTLVRANAQNLETKTYPPSAPPKKYRSIPKE